MFLFLLNGVEERAGLTRIRSMEIKVSFYGVLADITGMRVKIYSGISSFADLKLRLDDDFPALQHYNFRICHNSEFVNGGILLNDGDEIALVPPFFGG